MSTIFSTRACFPLVISKKQQHNDNNKQTNKKQKETNINKKPHPYSILTREDGALLR